MRKQYQRSWNGISFKDFIAVTDKSVADTTFYQSFYNKFFEIITNDYKNVNTTIKCDVKIS